MIQIYFQWVVFSSACFKNYQDIRIILKLSLINNKDGFKTKHATSRLIQGGAEKIGRISNL